MIAEATEALMLKLHQLSPAKLSDPALKRSIQPAASVAF
jgi:hypothetical protein